MFKKAEIDIAFEMSKNLEPKAKHAEEFISALNNLDEAAKILESIGNFKCADLVTKIMLKVAETNDDIGENEIRQVFNEWNALRAELGERDVSGDQDVWDNFLSTLWREKDTSVDIDFVVYTNKKGKADVKSVPRNKLD